MKRKGIIIFAASMALMLGACGGSYNKGMSASTSQSMDAAEDAGFAYNDYEEYEAECSDNGATDMKETALDGADIPEDVGIADYSQKLIRNYSYSFETTDFDKSLSYIEAQVTKYKGYIESSDTYGSSRKSSNMTIRIPEKNANAFIKEAGQIGEIIQKSESTEDITLKYYDTKSRLESLKAQHERILELLKKAESLEDIVALEEHLSDIEYQIDSYGSQLKVYDNLVNYVTINIDLQEVSQIQVVEEDNVWAKISKGFSRNTEDVLMGVVAFIVFLITSIPYFIMIGIFLAVIFVIIKGICKKSRRRKAKKQEKKDTENNE